MKPEEIKPISYVKAHAADLVRRLKQERGAIVVTQNGEATAVLQDIASYNQTQETLSLLKILALGNRRIERGRVVEASKAIARVRARRPRK